MSDIRDYIGGEIHIDGRSIPFRLVTGVDYLRAKLEWSEKKIDRFIETKTYNLLNQIMGLKQACFLLRHTSHSCGSIPDMLYDLKNRLIGELKEKHNFEFDDQFVNKYGMEERDNRTASSDSFQDVARQWVADQDELRNSSNPTQTFVEQLKRRRAAQTGG